MRKFLKRTLILASLVIFMLVGVFLFVPLPDQTNPWIKILGKPEYMNVDPRKPIDDQRRLVEIGERTFNIPLKYIDGQLTPGIKQEGMNLKYMLPDFRSLWDLKDREEYLKLFYAGHGSHLNIGSEKRMPEVSVSARNLLMGYAKNILVEKENGLEKFEGYRNYKGEYQLKDHFFLERDLSGEVIGYIKCNVDGTVEKPGCAHEFIDKKLRYNLYYTKKNYFSLWKDQKEKAIQFIDGFEIHNEQR